MYPFETNQPVESYQRGCSWVHPDHEKRTDHSISDSSSLHCVVHARAPVFDGSQMFLSACPLSTSPHAPAVSSTLLFASIATRARHVRFRLVVRSETFVTRDEGVLSAPESHHHLFFPARRAIEGVRDYIHLDHDTNIDLRHSAGVFAYNMI